MCRSQRCTLSARNPPPSAHQPTSPSTELPASPPARRHPPFYRRGRPGRTGRADATRDGAGRRQSPSTAAGRSSSSSRQQPGPSGDGSAPRRHPGHTRQRWLQRWAQRATRPDSVVAPPTRSPVLFEDNFAPGREPGRTGQPCSQETGGSCWQRTALATGSGSPGRQAGAGAMAVEARPSVGSLVPATAPGQAMPPPPARARGGPAVLDEDEWTDRIEAIVQRDFFPDLPKLQSRLEWLQVRGRVQPAGKQRCLAQLPRPPFWRRSSWTLIRLCFLDNLAALAAQLLLSSAPGIPWGRLVKFWYATRRRCGAQTPSRSVRLSSTFRGGVPASERLWGPRRRQLARRA